MHLTTPYTVNPNPSPLTPVSEGILVSILTRGIRQSGPFRPDSIASEARFEGVFWIPKKDMSFTGDVTESLGLM